MKHLKSYKIFESFSEVDDKFKGECNDYLSNLEEFEFIINAFGWYGTRQGMVRIQNKHKIITKNPDYSELRRFKMCDVKDDIVRMMGIIDFEFIEAITRKSDTKNINRPQDEHWDSVSEIPEDISMESIELYFDLLSNLGDHVEMDS